MLRINLNPLGTLACVFEQTRQILEEDVPRLIAEYDTYRKERIQEHLESNAILGDGFWYFVFNNPHLPRESLVSYLQNCERNVIVKSLCTTHQAGFDFLYRRMKFVGLHPAIKLWYVFWDDFYYSNKDMDKVKQYEDDFLPTKAQSICYRVLKRDALEKWLEDRQMLGTSPNVLNAIFLRSQLFNESNLDDLYRRIMDLQHPDLVAVKV